MEPSFDLHLARHGSLYLKGDFMTLDLAYLIATPKRPDYATRAFNIVDKQVLDVPYYHFPPFCLEFQPLYDTSQSLSVCIRAWRAKFN